MLSGQVSAREVHQAAHLFIPAAVDDETERAGHEEGIVELALRDVGLAHDCDGRCAASIEMALHRGHGYGLVAGHELALLVAGGKGGEKRGDEAGDHADSHENLGVLDVAFEDQIERSGARHDKTGRDDRSKDGVHELPGGPLVEDEVPPTREQDAAAGVRSDSPRGAASTSRWQR